MVKQNQTARAVIFNEDGKLLLMERRNKGKHYFVLPGGLVEDGESAEEATIREVHEETGLAVTIARLLYLGEDTYLQRQHIFLCNYHGGEPALQPESHEAKVMAKDPKTFWKPRWFNPEELVGLTLYPVGLMDYLDEDIAIDFTNNPREIVEAL